MHRSADTHQAVGAQQPYYLAYVPQDHSAVLRDYGELCTQLMAGWAGAATTAAPRIGRGAKRKVGIVSAHVCSHSVWHAFVRGWVEHLAGADVELYLWHTGHQVDAQTQWAGQRVRRLHQGLGDWGAWAKSIAAERLDALIYPEIGMDATTLRLSALRLVPLQLAGWGHPITTGLPTIDGFVSAQAFEPPEAQRYYTERLCAMPRLGSCYQPFGARPPPWTSRPGAYGLGSACWCALARRSSTRQRTTRYGSGSPAVARLASWSFSMPGHRHACWSSVCATRSRWPVWISTPAFALYPGNPKPVFLACSTRRTPCSTPSDFRLQHHHAGRGARLARGGLGGRLHARAVCQRHHALNGSG